MQAQAYAKEQGLFFRELQVSHAFHSHHMDPAMPAYKEALTILKPKKEQCLIFSSLTVSIAFLA